MLPGGEDRAQRVPEAKPVLRLAPDLDVGEQREQRAAPVGAAPGRRVVQAAVAWLR